ncbi:hypothetical protein DIPPA_01222 [Diplonema papillatum]|nr:hypothetical protein DIPPA_01222 [Diplonema papillatum]
MPHSSGSPYGDGPLLAGMPQPPRAGRSPSVGSGRVSPSRGGLCVHGIAAHRCAACCAHSPPLLPPASPRRVGGEGVNALQQVRRLQAELLSPSEASLDTREVAPLPSPGMEQPRRDYGSVEVVEPVRAPELPLPQPVRPQVVIEYREPEKLPIEDRGTQAYLKEDFGSQTTPPRQRPPPVEEPPLYFPPAPVRACGHSERARRRAERALDEAERLAALRAADEERLAEGRAREALLRQLRREGDRAAAAARQAALAKDAAEAALRDAADTQRACARTVQAEREAALRAKLEAQHAFDQAHRAIRGEDAAAAAAVAAEIERRRTEATVGQAGSLVDAAVQLLTAAQRDAVVTTAVVASPPPQRPQRRDISPSRLAAAGAPPPQVALVRQPAVPPEALEALRAQLIPLRDALHHRPQQLQQPLFLTSPPPPVIRTPAAPPPEHDQVSPPSRGFTADCSEYSDGPSPPEGNTQADEHSVFANDARALDSAGTLSTTCPSPFFEPQPAGSRAPGYPRQLVEELLADRTPRTSRTSRSLGGPPGGKPAGYPLVVRSSRPAESSPSVDPHSATLPARGAGFNLSSASYPIERDDSPPPPPLGGLSDTPGISAREVMQCEQQRAKRSSRAPPLRTSSQQSEMPQALADALRTAQRAESAQAAATKRAEQMERKAKALEAELQRLGGKIPGHHISAQSTAAGVPYSYVPRQSPRGSILKPRRSSYRVGSLDNCLSAGSLY